MNIRGAWHELFGHPWEKATQSWTYSSSGPLAQVHLEPLPVGDAELPIAWVPLIARCVCGVTRYEGLISLGLPRATTSAQIPEPSSWVWPVS